MLSQLQIPYFISLLVLAISKTSLKSIRIASFSIKLAKYFQKEILYALNSKSFTKMTLLTLSLGCVGQDFAMVFSEKAHQI